MIIKSRTILVYAGTGECFNRKVKNINHKLGHDDRDTFDDKSGKCYHNTCKKKGDDADDADTKNTWKK